MSRVALLTRPLPVHDGVLESLQVAGMRTLCVPTLVVLPQVDVAFEHALAARHYDGVVFVSQHAVHFATQRLTACGHHFAQRTWMAAVGMATSQAIRAQWPAAQVFKPDVDDAQDSEGLWRALNQAGLIVPEHRILMVRAQTGRDTLRQRLQNAQLNVDVWPCYQRQVLRWTDDEKYQVMQAMQRNGLVISATSIEGLNGLLAQFEAHDELFKQPLVALHPAIMHAAQQLGFDQTHCVAPHEMAAAIFALAV